MSKEIKDRLKRGKLINADKAEEQEMFALFHEPKNEFELKSILYEELESTEINLMHSRDLNQQFEKLWSKIRANKPKRKEKIFKLTLVSRIAAAVVIGLVVGIYISSIRSSSVPVYYSANAPKGSVSEMILPDSSIIFLNAGSSIKYSYDGDKGMREVFLNGEAWFNVQKNKKKPFIVHTTFYDVNVTGTQFNIKAYKSENKVTTTLEEGEVIISGTQKCKLANTISMSPGEQLSFDKISNKVSISNVNTKRFSSWKENKLIFVNMSFEELVVLLERKYGVDIEVKDDEILDLHFDGTIKNETIVELLEIIKITLPIDYQIVGQKIEILTKAIE